MQKRIYIVCHLLCKKEREIKIHIFAHCYQKKHRKDKPENNEVDYLLEGGDGSNSRGSDTSLRTIYFFV